MMPLVWLVRSGAVECTPVRTRERTKSVDFAMGSYLRFSADRLALVLVGAAYAFSDG